MGFSGVIFALKMLAGDSDGDFGLFSVPRSMSIWAELLIIQILVPNSSFVGHIAGILAGLTVTNIIPLFYCLTDYSHGQGPSLTALQMRLWTLGALHTRSTSAATSN